MQATPQHRPLLFTQQHTDLPIHALPSMPGPLLTRCARRGDEPSEMALGHLRRSRREYPSYLAPCGPPATLAVLSLHRTIMHLANPIPYCTS